MTEIRPTSARTALSVARAGFIASREPTCEADRTQAGYHADRAEKLAELAAKFAADCEREFGPLIADQLAVADVRFIDCVGDHLRDRFPGDELDAVFAAALAYHKENP